MAPEMASIIAQVSESIRHWPCFQRKWSANAT